MRRPSGVNVEPIQYDGRLLLWAKHRREAVIADAKMAEIAVEVGAELPPSPSSPSATIPGDARKLRGIPVVGVKGGFGGAIQGSRPGDGLA